MQFELLLKQLSLENFRLFDKLEVPFHHKLTVLIGENGAGKTALLEAIAKVLNVYVNVLTKDTLGFNPSDVFDDNDIKFGKQELSCDIKLETFRKESKGENPITIMPDYEDIDALDERFLEEEKKLRNKYNHSTSEEERYEIEQELVSLRSKIEEIELTREEERQYSSRMPKSGFLTFSSNYELGWEISYTKTNSIKKNITTFSFEELRKDAHEIQLRREKGVKIGVPVIKYYMFNRISNLNESNDNNEYSNDMLSIYDDALIERGLNIKDFFEWYKWQIEIDRVEETKTAKTVENAILQILNNETDIVFKSLDIEPTRDIRRFRLILVKDEAKLEFNQLSSGEKSMLILVADLARRLCVANPSNENPLHAQGIVLIDEIDLHLHPKWQAVVVEKLQRIFPNIQWVMTTHSPFVLQDVSKDNVLILDNQRLSRPEATFGQDIDSILTKTMNTQTKIEESELQEIFKMITLNDVKGAKGKIMAFENRKLFEGTLPKLEGAKAAIKRKEILAQ